MTPEIPRPNLEELFVTLDRKLTLEGLKLLQRMKEKIDDLEARVEALEP